MEHPDEPAQFSFSRAGKVSEKPDKVISVVVKDSDGEPEGLLEQWDTDEWFYAEVDALENLN